MGWRGPGGYQLVGRTIQMWNTWRRTQAFADQPWLLRFFDQIRFFPVAHDELAEARAAFPHGAYPLRIEDTTFRWADDGAASPARQRVSPDSNLPSRLPSRPSVSAGPTWASTVFVAEEGPPKPLAICPKAVWQWTARYPVTYGNIWLNPVPRLRQVKPLHYRNR